MKPISCLIRLTPFMGLVLLVVGLTAAPSFADVISKEGGPIARGPALSSAGVQAAASMADAQFPGLGASFVAGGGKIIIGEVTPGNLGTNNGTDIGVVEGKNTAETMARIFHEMMHCHFAGPGSEGNVDACTHSLIYSKHAAYLIHLILMLEGSPQMPSCDELTQVTLKYYDYRDACIASGGTPAGPPPLTPPPCQ